MGSVDDVANAAESCYDFFHDQKPKVPEQHRVQFISMLESTAESVLELGRALRAYFKPKGSVETVQECVRRISELQSRIDDREGELISEIFRSSLDKGEKLHLSSCISHISRVSDKIENAADALALASLKSIV